MPGLPIAVVPHPVAKLDAAGVAEIARGAIDEIVRFLETEATAMAAEAKAREVPRKAKLRWNSLFEGNYNAPGAPERFRGPDSLEAINRLLYSRGWTDGLPVIPPTVERWEAMLEGAGLHPDTEIGLIEPRLGQATVGKVATNAVMAGCEPAHMPVLIAAARGMTDPILNLKAVQSTTHPCAVMGLVNGPIAAEIDVNGTYNAMGQGTLANAAIGRAMRLMLLNIGGATPGIIDRATQGTPAKYGFCFAENEAENPWGEPLHVERGFDAGTSTITLAGVEGPHNVNDHYADSAEEILLQIAGMIAAIGSNNAYLRGEILVALGPEHAHLIHRDGFSKDDARRFLFEHAIIPGNLISRPTRKLLADRVPERLIGPDGRDGLRMVTEREQIMFAVVGGAGRHSAVIHSFGNTRAVTVPIDSKR